MEARSRCRRRIGREIPLPCRCRSRAQAEMEIASIYDLWHALYYPWTQGIMQRALIEVALLGVAGGAIGCWIVLYEISFSAEALAHSMFPGLVVAALVGLPVLLGGVVGIVFAAIAIALAGRIPRTGRDAAVAVVVIALRLLHG